MHGQSPEHRFLLRAAELLHAYGTPAHRLERVLGKMALRLDVQAAFLVTPTSVMASFGLGEDERAHLLRIEPGAVDLGKLVEFDQVLEDVEHRRATVADGLARLEQVAAAPPRFGPALTALAFGLASAGAARFFGGGLAEIGVSFALGPVIFALGRLLPRRPASVELYEPLAAFLAAGSALLLSRLALPCDDRIVTLSALIVLLPGLTLTIAMTELATRHLVSGVARLAGAAAVFLTILLGVALAWRLGAYLPPPLERAPCAPSLWSEVLALLLAPLAFAVILEARPKEFPIVLATGLAGYLAARAGAVTLGPELAPFLGALVVGLASNGYARVWNHPALVPQTPGILLLVPGSLGYRSLTSFLDREALVGMEWAFQTTLVGVSLVGGLLAANALLPPRRVL